MKDEKLNVLFIDNFDSFVFNLVDEFEKRDCDVTVWRNDISTEKALEIYASLKKPALIVISPGPGTPEDAGCSVELLKNAPHDIPFLGVCLGHQCMVEVFGGKVVGAKEIVHGKSSVIEIKDGSVLFEGQPENISIGRYHSLIGEVDSSEFKITAKLDELVMGIEHKSRKMLGVQFHPESILSPAGGKMVENVIAWAKKGD